MKNELFLGGLEIETEHKEKNIANHHTERHNGHHNGHVHSEHIPVHPIEQRRSITEHCDEHNQYNGTEQ